VCAKSLASGEKRRASSWDRGVKAVERPIGSQDEGFLEGRHGGGRATMGGGGETGVIYRA